MDMQAHTADNMELIVAHQRIDAVYRTVGAVFNRQDAILAKALINRLEHAFKIAEIQDICQGEQLITGLL